MGGVDFFVLEVDPFMLTSTVWLSRYRINYGVDRMVAQHPTSYFIRLPLLVRCWLAVRTIDAYSPGLCHGTKEFKHNVYRSHRQVEDMSKW